jgi:hypothetical protein
VTLADLIDLEAQLARDRDADLAALEARDRALLGGRVAEPDRGRAIARWLDALRDAEPGRGWPGQAAQGALRTTRALLALAGLLLGWGAATALLQFRGGHPVNVWDVLLAFVGVQALLLVLLALSFFLPLAAAGAPLAGPLRGALGALLARLARRGGDRAAEWRALWHRLRSRRSLYHHVEPWLLLASTQGFGVAFNVGALAALLRLVVFTDLAFGWSTTLVDLDAARFHALMRGLALPWAWLWPDAVPSAALVEATRYSHLEGAYLGAAGAARAARPDAVGGWWRFLAAALAAYGLLPRLALLALARARAARLLRRLPLDDAEVARLAARLAAPRVSTRGLPEATAPEAEARPPVAAAPVAAPGRRCAVVRWRDAPAGGAVAAAVAALAGCEPGEIHDAGGAGVDAARLAAGGGPVAVVAESWEAPDKATLRLLRDLRGALGPRRPLLVVLVDTAGGAPREPGAGALRLWREGLAALEDPWLAVEPLREAA